MTIHLHAFRCGESNYNYLFWAQGSKRAVVIDPLDAKIVNAEAARLGLRIKYIVNTHGHLDHIEGNEAVAREQGAAILAPAQEKIPGMSKPLREGDTIDLDGLTFKVLETPGHTAGHICLIVNDAFLVAGDTLFLGGCGNCKFGGDVNQLYDSLQRLKTLPDHLKILCGHEYALKNLAFCQQHEAQNPAIAMRLAEVRRALQRGEIPATTLGQEKSYNVFLRAPDRATFSALRSARNTF